MLQIKNVIQEQRIPVNKFQLIVQPGVGLITVVSLTGLEEELDAPELPDRTVRSGGRGKPVEFDIVQPMHHTAEVALMELWWNLCKYSLLGYIKDGTLSQFNETGIPAKSFFLPNLWISKRAHTDLELENEGEMSAITWTMKADELMPMP